MSDPMNDYLKPTTYLDYEADSISSFVQDIAGAQEPRLLAVQLYLLVRDFALYDPYHLDLRPAALKASNIVHKKRAWCVEKAILLAALLRRYGIPSRLGFAIVTNHIGVEKLVHYLRKEEIVFHGYVEAYINGKWSKCTPAFDRRICRISGVDVLDWDGQQDSLFQAFAGDKQFMVYNHFYGEFADVPQELMQAEMKRHYPHLFTHTYHSKEFSFFHTES